MASEIKVDTIVNAGGDNDSGIDLATNDTIKLNIAGAEKARVDSDGNFFLSVTGSTSGFQSSSSESGSIIYAAGGIASNSASNDVAGVFNRLGSDGPAILCKNDGVSCIEIGNTGGSGDGFIQATGDRVGLDFGTFNIVPRKNNNYADNAVDIGHPSYRYDDIYATNGTIQTSDQNEKQDIASATAKELNVAKKLSALFKTFRWKDKVLEKGDKARTHTGIIAQEIQSAFSAEGLDASDYGLFISDTWTDDDGKEQTRLGVRYPELFSFIFSSIEARLTALESK